VRLHKVMPEYEGRVRVRVRPFPLEVAGSGPAPRDILEQEDDITFPRLQRSEVS
jgi:hypothetical protein